MYFSKKITKMTKEELIKNLKKIESKNADISFAIAQKSAEFFDDDAGRERYMVSDEYKKLFITSTNLGILAARLEKEMIKRGYAYDICKIHEEITTEQLEKLAS